MMQNPCHLQIWYNLKIHVSPLSSQKAYVLANYTKFTNHFSNLAREMETPDFTVNCTKSTQFASPHGESHEISAIHANF